MQPAEFDAHAADYENQHAASIRISGEDTAYFSQYKVADVHRIMSASGRLPVRILDFGAGIGNALPFLQGSFPQARITCLDVSRDSLAICERRSTAPVEIVIYEGTEIPFDENSFDTIFTACVFHHIDPERHIELLKEIRRVLQPGGSFFLFEHNPWNPLTQYAVRTCPFDEDAILISAPQMRRRLRDAGFARVDTAFRVFFPAFLSALRPVESSLRWLPLGAQYCIIAS